MYWAFRFKKSNSQADIHNWFPHLNKCQQNSLKLLHRDVIFWSIYILLYILEVWCFCDVNNYYRPSLFVAIAENNTIIKILND